MTNIEEAREFFKKDLYASQTTGIEIVDVEPGYAKCSLKIEDKHKNALGQVMGGVFFVMADYAFAIASNFKQPTTVTQSSQVTFLTTVKGTTLYAEAEKVRGGRKTSFYKISVYDDTDELVAYVTMTGYVIGEKEKSQKA
jgi:acyl-CoA thioesterase